MALFLGCCYRFFVSGDNLKRAAVLHTTTYCGSVELACIKLKVPVLSVSENPVNHGFTLLTVSQSLLEEKVLQIFVVGVLSSEGYVLIVLL